MSKTLVIILSETRAHEITFDNFKKNVIDRLNADLCLCIGVKPDYNYSNPLFKLAKYKFLYEEPNDFGDAFDYAYNELSNNRPKYECLENTNTLYGVLKSSEDISENIVYYGNDNFDMECYNDDEIVVHKQNFKEENWKNKIFGIKKSTNDNFIFQENVDTYKKPLYWREFLKIKDQYMGGIKDSNNQHPGSAAILIFFRWFLLKNLIENDLINKYDRFIITRSDFIYQLPHPMLESMDKNYIWIPDEEHYGGYTDRHVILSKDNIEYYLNILNNMVLKSNDYFNKMKLHPNWNLEKLIKFNLEQNNVIHLVREFPYIMYSIRPINGTTRWTEGVFSNELGCYIKYPSEFKKSSYYKNQFEIHEKSEMSIDDFYRFYKFLY